jgi:cytochrome c553
MAGILAMLARAAPALLAQTPSPSSSISAAAITAKGNGSAAACVSCHGPKLEGKADGGVPRLTGLSAGYLEAQLDAFAAGTRKSAIMMPVATSLSPVERDSLAAYLGRLPVAPAAPAANATGQAGRAASVRQGEILATRGRWSSDLPACDRCHGPGGVGVGTAFPPLAGQPPSYLASQLDAWKKGLRPPGPLDLMSTIAARMSESDIQAVAAYYAALPTTPTRPAGGRP